MQTVYDLHGLSEESWSDIFYMPDADPDV